MEAPQGDPRAWTREQVNQWIASNGGSKSGNNLEGNELCLKTRSWFQINFPGVGEQLCRDLRQRREVINNERRLGDKRTAKKRVTEETRAAFLVMALQISMIFFVLGERLSKARDILNHLYQLVNVVKRRAAKDAVDPDLFKERKMDDSIKYRSWVESTQVTLVSGSKCIALADETYNKAVMSLCGAMDVIGAPLTIKIKMATWKKVLFIGASAAAIGVTAGGAAAVFGASLGASALIGGAAALTTATVLAIADSGGNKHLLMAYEVFLATEQKTVEFMSNYLRAVLLVTTIVDRSDMTESQLERIIDDVNRESRDSVIQQVEHAIMEKLPRISYLQGKLSQGIYDIRTGARFNYRATAWLKDDSVEDVNDSILIAYLQFGMRNLVRDEFILGVIGPEGDTKKTLVRSLFPNAGHNDEQKSCDIVLYDGSCMQGPVPVLQFPSGNTEVMKATLGLWTRSCSAFICVVDDTPGYPDLRDLETVAGLCVPVLLCINTKGRVRSQTEADEVVGRYKYRISSSLVDLVQVILIDVSSADSPPWVRGTGDVKYWVQDATDNHKENAQNIDKDFRDSL